MDVALNNTDITSPVSGSATVYPVGITNTGLGQKLTFVINGSPEGMSFLDPVNTFLALDFPIEFDTALAVNRYFIPVSASFASLFERVVIRDQGSLNQTITDPGLIASIIKTFNSTADPTTKRLTQPGLRGVGLTSFPACGDIHGHNNADINPRAAQTINGTAWTAFIPLTELIPQTQTGLLLAFKTALTIEFYPKGQQMCMAPESTVKTYMQQRGSITITNRRYTIDGGDVYIIGKYYPLTTSNDLTYRVPINQLYSTTYGGGGNAAGVGHVYSVDYARFQDKNRMFIIKVLAAANLDADALENGINLHLSYLPLAAGDLKPFKAVNTPNGTNARILATYRQGDENALNPIIPVIQTQTFYTNMAHGTTSVMSNTTNARIPMAVMSILPNTEPNNFSFFNAPGIADDVLQYGGISVNNVDLFQLSGLKTISDSPLVFDQISRLIGLYGQVMRNTYLDPFRNFQTFAVAAAPPAQVLFTFAHTAAGLSIFPFIVPRSNTDITVLNTSLTTPPNANPTYGAERTTALSYVTFTQLTNS